MCVCIYMYTCMHKYIHIYMHACMHAYIHTYMHTCMHACMHTYIHTHALNTFIDVYTTNRRLSPGRCVSRVGDQIPSAAQAASGAISDNDMSLSFARSATPAPTATTSSDSGMAEDEGSWKTFKKMGRARMPPPPPRSPSTNPTEPPSPDCRSTSVTSTPVFRAAPRPRTPGRSGGAGVQGRGAGDWIFRPLGRQTQGLGQPGRTSAICWKATALWGYVAARTSKQQALLRPAIVPALFELYDCFQILDG